MPNIKESFYRHIAQTSDNPAGLEIDYAEGPYIYTTDGQKYVDFISGIAVSSLGHRHPAVVAAIKEQVDRHLHVMVYGEFIQEAQSKYAALLTQNLPDRLNRVYPVNSGTEAVEGALKLAKKHTGRHKFIGCKNGYHGDTHGSLSVTGRDVYRNPYKPLLPGVNFMEFNSFEHLEMIDDETAAVILEPIQGEGGVIPARQEWLKEVRERCNKKGALLIFDEIQTGFYRTGSLFAFIGYGVEPDILCLAKAMAGGMPMGAFVSSDTIFEAFKYDPPLNHVTTFGGHPVSCAAAYATLRELLKGKYGEKAAQIEQVVRKELKGKGIREIRGKGAMLGMELDDPERTRKVVEECLKQGIILGWTLHSETLVRLAPPLIISGELLTGTLRQVKQAVEKFS